MNRKFFSLLLPLMMSGTSEICHPSRLSRSVGSTEEERNLSRGPRQFTRDGITVWALNQKSADKKISRMIKTVN